MILKRHFLLFIAFIIPLIAAGQNQDFKLKGISFEVDYGYGFVMPHHKSIEYFLEDHIQTFDFKIYQTAHGKKYWNQLYRYPVYGAGFYRSNLGNNDVYGYANAIYSFLKVPVLGKSDDFNLSYQIGFGASWITNYFDVEENPGNLAIGSNLNIFIDFGLQTGIPIGKRVIINSALRFTHFSNGKVKSPNKGLNVVSGSVGLAYKLRNQPEKIITDLPEIKSKNNYSIIYAGGIKTISRYETGYYYVSSLIFDYARQYSLKGKWSTGADLFYDGTNIQHSEESNSNIVNSDLYQMGIHAGHDLLVGKLSVVVNLGIYLYSPVEVPSQWYNRIGLRYTINEKYITNLTLKSHRAKASFIEWGIGYNFN